tara:strand:+ start:1579 stop:2043 length:465 start_codon:yes stop_codon:yes gene_type:complete
MKKILIILLIISLQSCGYKSLIKESTDQVTFNKIEYKGDSKLNFLLKSKLNLKKSLASQNSILISTSSNLSSLDKSSTGEIISKDIVINSNISIYTNKKLEFSNSFSEKKTLKIGSNLSSNLDTIESAKSNLINNIANDIELDIKFYEVRKSDN